LEKSFSPKQVADALDVSESSIKRWCDRGAIRTVKTFGGHRRIPLEGLLTFLEETKREISNHAALGMELGRAKRSGESPSDQSKRCPVDDASIRQFFEDALIRGDENECRRLLIEHFDRHASFAVVADELIAPAFRGVGELWHRGDVEVFQERRACELCSRLIQEFRRLFPEPSSTTPLAMGGSSSGDNYALPGRLVEVVLREIGWRSMNLGVNLPFDTLREAVRIEKPKLVWLSASHLTNKEVFADELKGFWESLPKETLLVVGGRELTDDFRPRLRYTSHCDNLQQLVRLAESLRPKASRERLVTI
jgi:excisionase family DNA binding protein